MALKPCPECGRQISTGANACPHCGHTGRREISSGWAWLVVGIALFVFMVMIGMLG